MEKARTEADAVAEIVSSHVPEARVVMIGEEDGVSQVLLVPRHASGVTAFEVHDVRQHLDKFLERPRRRVGVATLNDLESLIAHANRFKRPESALFADTDPKRPRLQVIIDYHEEGEDGEASWLEHRGVFQFPLSDEWSAWQAVHDVPMSVEAFAEFIESHLTEVVPAKEAGPRAQMFVDTFGCKLAEPADLLSLSKGLAVKVETKVVRKLNTQSGEGQIQFEEAHKSESGDVLTVPGAFVVGIPVVRGGARYQIPVRLRYRVGGGAVKFTVSLHRPALVFDSVIQDACYEARDKTGLPLFFGSPERPE